MIAAPAVVLLLLAALLPPRYAGAATATRALGGLGLLMLLPAAGDSGAWPFVLLAAVAVALGTPLALGCAAAGATLVALRPDASAPLAVSLAALGAAAAADALHASLRSRRASGGDPAVPVLVAGAFLGGVLLLVDHQALLHWSFGVGEANARVVLPGVGVALGAALVAAVGGVLLLGAGLLAPSAAARRGGLGVLGLAVVGALGGLAIALVRVLSLDQALRDEAGRPLALLVLASSILAVLLMDALRPEPPEPVSARRLELATTIAVGVAAALAVAAGVESWWREGAYATAFTASAAAAALLGLAALEPEARLQSVRRGLLLAALLWLLIA